MNSPAPEHPTTSAPDSTTGQLTTDAPTQHDVRLDSIDIVVSVDGAHWVAHAHAEHELLSAITHTVTVITDTAVHVAPRGTSIWIPAFTRHEVIAAPGNSMRCTWFAASEESTYADKVVVARMPSLLDDVLAHVARSPNAGARRRAEAFAVDLLRQSQPPLDGLPMPRSPWLRTATDALIAHAADSRTIAELAAASAASVRTFSRQFAAEVGMPFSQWRTELRLQLAMSRLQEGISVGVVARQVGFESLSAFSAAFRQRTGVTPSAFASLETVADQQPDSADSHKRIPSLGRSI